MCNDNNAMKESFTDSWAVCCYIFFVSLLFEGINVCNGILLVSLKTQNILILVFYNITKISEEILDAFKYLLNF